MRHSLAQVIEHLSRRRPSFYTKQKRNVRLRSLSRNKGLAQPFAEYQ
jgi:hypothetical protein